MNPENTLGVMSYSGNRVELKTTQTNDVGALISAVNGTEINGYANFMTGVKVA
jgi:hypothetical protein